MVTCTVSDLRKNTIRLMKKVKMSKEPIVVFLRAKPVAVLMNYEDYETREARAKAIPKKVRADAFDFLTNPKKGFPSEPFSAVDLIRSLR
ncbi:type II toxin-antitoxin system Phd/YefM family antitoxin [Candidatus Peregrinibacteria bacterium]|nr:MAG: type II toxin-antitoxin system Phd/YefM family antitoxin [Candidatus Peregrinibacteria bacterium]